MEKYVNGYSGSSAQWLKWHTCQKNRRRRLKTLDWKASVLCVYFWECSRERACVCLCVRKKFNYLWLQPNIWFYLLIEHSTQYPLAWSKSMPRKCVCVCVFFSYFFTWFSLFTALVLSRFALFMYLSTYTCFTLWYAPFRIKRSNWKPTVASTLFVLISQMCYISTLSVLCVGLVPFPFWDHFLRTFV